MQLRWNYKLDPNQSQLQLMEQWLVTLRKHRNYCLKERQQGWETNNRDADQPISYAYGAYCDLENRDAENHLEVGAFCPLTCPVVKHGVVPIPSYIPSNAAIILYLLARVHPIIGVLLQRRTPQDLTQVPLTKVQSKTDPDTGERISRTVWDSASGIQSKRTTRLRRSPTYKRINVDVLQRNLAKLDSAYQGFWNHKRGFPAFRRRSTFNSFEYKPEQVKFQVMRVLHESGKHRYSRVYLPGIGSMRYFDSRPIPETAEVRTVTVKRQADGWYMSVLLRLPESLPTPTPVEQINSINGLDVGINRLIASSDGSFVENPRFATNPKTRRLLRLRQRRVNRKRKGSQNRAKAGKRVAKLHRKVALKREAYQWKAAQREVEKAEAIAHEDLNIVGMKKRCKPIRSQPGRFLPNGQSAKRGLNRAISDAAWGELLGKIAWLALKQGKPVLKYNPRNTSRECSKCGHISADNREGEKFLCEVCGHLDHADTQAARTGLKRIGLKFVSRRRKNLPEDFREVTPVSHASAQKGERKQGRNPKSKVQRPETGISERIA